MINGIIIAIALVAQPAEAQADDGFKSLPNYEVAPGHEVESVQIQGDEGAEIKEVETKIRVQKEVRYKKITEVDLDGSDIDGKSQVPSAFYVGKMKAPDAESLLEQRLKFKMRNYNRLGF
jgi:hypothetical protein